MAALHLTPEVTVTAVKRTASSGCCAAKLAPGPQPRTYTCQACGQQCERILSDPEEVTLHG